MSHTEQKGIMSHIRDIIYLGSRKMRAARKEVHERLQVRGNISVSLRY